MRKKHTIEMKQQFDRPKFKGYSFWGSVAFPPTQHNSQKNANLTSLCVQSWKKIHSFGLNRKGFWREGRAPLTSHRQDSRPYTPVHSLLRCFVVGAETLTNNTKRHYQRLPSFPHYLFQQQQLAKKKSE